MQTAVRILIVDDSKDDTELIVHALRSGGFDPVYVQVDEETGLKSALLAETWDIICTDYSMPCLAASQVLAIIQEFQPGTPVLVVSGAIDIQLVVTLMKAGARDYVSKHDLARLPLAIARELQELEQARANEVTQAERKQAEEALRQEQIFTAALFESIPGYLYVYDDQGKLIRWNKKHEEMTGYSAAELSHMTMEQWFEGEDAIRVAAAVEKVFATGYGEVEAQLLIKGGGKLPIHSTGAHLVNNGKSYFVGIGIDITKQKEAEAVLLRFNEELEHKVKTRTRELASVNQQLIAGHDELAAMNEELTAMNEQLQGLTEMLTGEIERRRRAEENLRQMNADLEERVSERTADLADANRCLEQELQERLRVEAALREKEEWYRAMMEQSWDAIALVDAETKVVLESNRRWHELSGYSAVEIQGMSAYDLVDEKPEKLDQRYEQLRRDGHSEPTIARLRAKNGALVEAERVGSLLQVGGKEALLFCIRDLSAEKRLQYQIYQDMLLAGEVQKNMLPGDFNDTWLAVETIYHPCNLVSGDFFDYGWSDDYLRFSGFVLDVSGHGVASSLLGIVISTYFRDALNSPMNLASRLNWVNRQVYAYFAEDNYGAAIYFEFDFLQHTLTYAGAGVHTLLTASGHLPRQVLVPGSLIGVCDNPEFGQWTVPFEPGDAFYFLTDGIYERLTGSEDVPLPDFSRAVEFFRSVAVAADQRDDCSGVCIQIKDQEQFPLVMKYHRHGRNNRIRAAVRQLLNRLAGEEAGKLNVAFGEALTNAARQSMDVRVRINRLGNRLVIRVRDNGTGFAGNERVAAIRADVDGTMFEQILLAEGGRGIMIMVAWMDAVLYSHKGNEVMLVKKLSRK